MVDWFTPFRDKDRGHEVPTNVRRSHLDDQDLGSAGPLVIEDKGIVLGAGKDGVLYVLNQNNLGKAFRDFSKPNSQPDLTKLKSPPTSSRSSPAPARMPRTSPSSMLSS